MCCPDAYDATDLAAQKTVSVTGYANQALNAGVADTVTAIEASGTSSAATIYIDGTQTTYTGGTGVDTVSLVTGTTLDKAIDPDARDDTAVFGLVLLLPWTVVKVLTTEGAIAVNVTDADTGTADVLNLIPTLLVTLTSVL